MTDKTKPPDPKTEAGRDEKPAAAKPPQARPKPERRQVFWVDDTFDIKNLEFKPADLRITDVANWKPIDWQPVEWVEAQNISVVDPATLIQSRDLDRQIAELKRARDEQAAALKEAKQGSKQKEDKINELQTTVNELREKEQLSFLLERVNPAAQRALLKSSEFRAEFTKPQEVAAYVMSVDIRRSTELMLKARKPEQFAEFITTLCTDLMKIVTDTFGVVDKFTGDGVLAFFPEFFSGADAGYLVLAAANRCHEAFAKNYRAFRNCFTSVLNDVGLGIGIDYGSLRLVQMAGGLTVVGQPVVYACRMGGCPAGKTLLNQPAYEQITQRFSGNVFVQETEIEIKHEGRTLAYEIVLNRHEYQPRLPDWLSADPGA